VKSISKCDFQQSFFVKLKVGLNYENWMILGFLGLQNFRFFKWFTLSGNEVLSNLFVHFGIWLHINSLVAQ